MSFETFRRQVARKIKRARELRGLRQKDMPFPIRRYQKIESGKANLTLKSLYRIATLLETNVDELIEREDRDRTLYHEVFQHNPLGIIVWKLLDPKDPFSLTVYDHNEVASTAVYRDLELARGKPILEIFSKAGEQGVVEHLYEVILTGRAKVVPELVRHDTGFPLTVFSTKFIRCGPDLGAAIFRDITDEYLARQERNRQRRSSGLPLGHTPL